MTSTIDDSPGVHPLTHHERPRGTNLFDETKLLSVAIQRELCHADATDDKLCHAER